MSEQSDAVIVVASEETGTVSLVINGKIISKVSEETLRKELKRRLERDDKQIKSIKQIKPQIMARIGKKN